MADNDNARPMSDALRDQLHEAKLSCASTAIVIDVELTCAEPGEALSAEKLENLKDTAQRTIEALQLLQAALAARSDERGRPCVS
jgi:hypothetical protein